MSFTTLDLANDVADNVSVQKSKGQAIPGLDYGIDMVNEKPKEINEMESRSASPKPVRSSPSPRASPQASIRSQPQSQQQPIPDQFYQQSQSSMHSAAPQQSNGGFFMEQDESMGSASEQPHQGYMQQQQGFVQPGMFDEYEEEPQMSYQEKRQRKIDLIAEYRRLKEAGYMPAGDIELTMSSDLDDIEETVGRMKAQKELDTAIKFQRKMLIGFSTLVENFMSPNSRWNIFDLHLDGWSENVFENISDYDEVFEELHYKYKDAVSTPPEIRLIGMVVGSAWMYHMSRDIFKKSANVPGFNDVMNKNPALRQQYQSAAMNMTNQSMPNTPAVNMMRNMAQQTQQQRQRQQGPAAPRQTMSDPYDVDDLLGSLTGGQQQPPSSAQQSYEEESEMVTDSEIDLSEIEDLSELA